MKNNNKGISLIVLVITIIVIIVIAGAIILSLAQNNPITQASKAAYLSDLRSFQNELLLYQTKEYASKTGQYEVDKLQADSTSVTYNGVIDSGKTINDIIPSLAASNKYKGQFRIVDGKLVFEGTDTNEQNWARESGIEVTSAEPVVQISTPNKQLIAQGTDIVYTIEFSSVVAITNVDLTGKIEVLDNAGVPLTTQPVITIGTLSGTNADTTRQLDITIKTDTLTNGGYKLRIKSGSVTNASNVSNSQNITSVLGFDIDNTAPENPTMVADVTAWTNGSVAITITYSTDSDVKEYSLDSTTWNTYTVPVVVNTNNTTIYARGKDSSGNQSGVATFTVSNIDKVAPTVTYGTNGGYNPTQVSTAVAVSDISGSGVNITTLQYIWDAQNTVAPSSGWTVFTNGTTLTKNSGVYYLWIKASDNVGNESTTVSNLFAVVTAVNNFTYTGAVQNYVVPLTGTYRFEVWGAAGANFGGNGSYAKGEMALTAGQTIKIYVGGSGDTSGFNGGGTAGTGANVGYRGGGATDIRTVDTLAGRIIVAGGGGGAGAMSNGEYAGASWSLVYGPGYGGAGDRDGSAGASGNSGSGGKFATTSAGGAGGAGGPLISSAVNKGLYWQAGGGGGGGGYYGGGGGGSGMLSGSSNSVAGGAGVAGTLGVGGRGGNATYSTSKNGEFSSCGGGGGGGSSYTGTLANAVTYPGNVSFLSPGGFSTVGNSGNGYARITLL